MIELEICFEKGKARYRSNATKGRWKKIPIWQLMNNEGEKSNE